MLALADSPQQPAQFVFDRSWLLPRAAEHQGALLAFVISLCQLPPRQLQAAVLQQVKTQLGLDLQPVQTVVEKRATIAATPAAFAAKGSCMRVWACACIWLVIICTPCIHPP